VELEKKAQAARQQQHVMAGCIAATNASPWSTSMPVYVPGVISPSQAAFYNDGPSATPGCVTPNLSPHYQDALPHGGFNPNNLYSPAYEQREPGPGADGDPFTGRRGPLEFDGAGAEGAEEEGGVRTRRTMKRRGWRMRTTTRTKRAARKKTRRVPVTMISWRSTRTA
jgi:hypothetical protein